MIKIQNIYYMLTYAYQILRKRNYAKCATEPFENVEDLLSAILAIGITAQIKRGLERTYTERCDTLNCPRGKIDVTASLKQESFIKQKLICCFDELSVNSYRNRVLKTTVEILLRSNIPITRKRELRKLMLYFDGIETLDINSINWHFQYNRNNQTYQMLISVCWLIINGLLQTTQEGSLNVLHFDEQNMGRLYEKFILEYYRHEYPQLKAAPAQIAWALDDDMCEFLPQMQSDVMLFHKSCILIIDAKYYQSHTFQSRYHVQTQYSGNLYQMFTYVKNKAAAGYKTSGLILYAKTDEAIQPNQTYHMSGNAIGVKTLDLNCDFSEIKAQLNAIADNFILESE